MYLPSGACLRNLYPANWRLRTWRHKVFSASVDCFLRCRALETLFDAILIALTQTLSPRRGL